jgi:hypothetical protein
MMRTAMRNGDEAGSATCKTVRNENRTLFTVDHFQFDEILLCNLNDHVTTFRHTPIRYSNRAVTLE